MGRDPLRRAHADRRADGLRETLAAFPSALDDLFREGLTGALPDETRVVYVSPLKALSADVHRNLASRAA